MKKIIGVICFSLIGIALARNIVYKGPLVSDTGLAYSNSYAVDLNSYGVDELSVQVVMSTASFSNISFTDGKPSTATITISPTGFASLSAQYAGAVIKISSNNPSAIPAGGVQVTLNGYVFGGYNFYDATYSSMSALNLKNLINATGVFIATSSSNLVYASSTIKGTFANSWVITTSTPAALNINGSTTLSSSLFYGGLDNARVTIGTCVYEAGNQFTVGVSSQLTAKSLSDAIAGVGSCLSGIVTSTWTGNIVAATATTVGTLTNYALFTSTPILLNLNGSTSNSSDNMKNGTDSAVLTSVSGIYAPNHKLTTGLKAVFIRSAGSGPGMLVTGTTYYVIPYDSNTVRLAASSANAVSGTNVSIATQTTLGGGTFALNPLSYLTTTSTPSVHWMVSNDGVNYSSYTTHRGISVPTFNYTVTVTSSSFFDFGDVNFRFLKAIVNSPQNGAVNVVITANGDSHN